MGSGSYSTARYMTNAADKGYAAKSVNQIFTQRNINNAMDPKGVTFRESLDSIEHPNTVPIIIALDVTGSMGNIPAQLVKSGFPTIMDTVIKAGIADPQVLFLGIGDHECDQSPLQVGQFESSDELLDKWLTSVYLEGGGGGNNGESYLLAWYFAANHTKIDSFDKRGKKGFLFTIGDEPTLKHLPQYAVKAIMGTSQASDYTSDQLLEMASEKYNVFHIHVKETRSGSYQPVMDGWKQLIQNDLIIVENKEQIPTIIADTILKYVEKDEIVKPIIDQSIEVISLDVMPEAEVVLILNESELML